MSSKLDSIVSFPSVAYVWLKHSAGYGLEIPCKYVHIIFFGSNLYIERLQAIVDEQRPDGLL